MERKNIFQFRSPDQQLHDINESVNLAMQVVGDRARKCLDQEDFKAYRAEYKATEEKLVGYLIKYNRLFHKTGQGNINTYAFQISYLLTQLENVRALLETVTENSKKGLNNEKSKV